ncbi:MAG: response regulator [Candidatus Kerfeldbacteria bacterium]|nr:response regulator [Candidatus Kerfeldbacteria bacterium]
MDQGQKRKILLVEDDKFLAELCMTKMEKENFTVVLAMDGEEGLQKIDAEKPDLILLDIMLPGIDGFEVLDRVRKHSDPKIAKTPIVLLSNLGQDSSVERGLALGADDYLIKANFTTDEIVKKIVEVLEKRAKA